MLKPPSLPYKSRMRRVGDYHDFLSALYQSMVRRSSFIESEPLREVLTHPRIVVALNHATPLSWIPAIGLLAQQFHQAGGQDRIPRGVFDRFFYGNPITRPIAEWISQSSMPPDFDEVLRIFQSDPPSDLVVFPEGAHSFFGDVKTIQPFRSCRFIEVAIRSKAPILLAVHAGSEDWNFRLDIPKEWVETVSLFSSFFGTKLKSDSSLNLPIRLGSLAHFRMHTQLIWPTLNESELSNDPLLRRQQLASEGEFIRERMRALLNQLDRPQTKNPGSHQDFQKSYNTLEL